MTVYKCPHCGARIEYNSSSGQMKCPYCDSEFTLDEAKAASSGSSSDSSTPVWAEETSEIENGDSAPVLTEEPHAQNSGSSWKENETSDYGIYHCTSCGAELICDSTTAATRCPYCDNVIVLQSRLSGELKPDMILPFQISREQAVNALSEHFSGKKLLPKVFTAENHLEEVKGVYVPFWLYDTTADASATYKMTNVRTWSDRDYTYTETSHFTAERQGSLAFEAVPVDGLQEMANDLMESIETFDVSQAVPFRPEYLSGFYANRYDVDSDTAISRAAERITKSAAEALDATVCGYATISRTSGSAKLVGTRVSYALFPVWLLNTSWRGKTYLFAMNGQSGRFVGNLPVDQGKYWMLRSLFSVLIGGVIYAGIRFLGFI